MSGHVFLIGFMGSGKSTVGRLVARDLSLPFADLDERIVGRVGRSIPEIFASEGESSFRIVERTELEGLATEPCSVVACGGGVVGDASNRAFLSAHGTVFYLEMTADDVQRRVRDDGSRPMLSRDPEHVARLLEDRRSLYEQAAHITVTTTDRSVRDVADEVLRAVEAA